MTYYEDLSPCDYFWRYEEQLTAVGWLSSRHRIAPGEVQPAFVDKLQELLAQPWAPGCFLGSHTCPFCRKERGSRNLFVPGTDTVFVAPELVLHYVRKHRYQPPPAFQKAVLDCPAMESPEYFAALQAAGLDVVEFSMPPGLLGQTPSAGRR